MRNPERLTLAVAAAIVIAAPAAAAESIGQRLGPSMQLALPAGEATVSVNESSNPDATLVVGTNNSPYDVRFSGFGFTEERVLSRRDSVSARCVAGETVAGTIHVFDGAVEQSMPFAAACGSVLHVR